MREFTLKIEMSGNEVEIETVKVDIKGNKILTAYGLTTLMADNIQFASLIQNAAKMYSEIKAAESESPPAD